MIESNLKQKHRLDSIKSVVSCPKNIKEGYTNLEKTALSEYTDIYCLINEERNMSEQNEAGENKPDENTHAPAETTQTESEAFNLNTVINDAKKVIFDPVGFYKPMPTTGGYVNPLIFVAVMVAATMLIGFVLNLIGLVKFNAIVGGGVGLSMLVIGPIVGVIASFIVAGIMFVIWKLMGSEKDYEAAYRCVAYSSAIAPVIAVISLIPYVAGLIKALWSGFLIYTASIEVHKIKAQTAMIVIGILTALNVIVGFSSERTMRSFSGKMAGFEQAAKELEKSYKSGSIGAAAKHLENIDEMTPEEAGKQMGEFLKGLEDFSKGLEESVKENEKTEN